LIFRTLADYLHVHAVNCSAFPAQGPVVHKRKEFSSLGCSQCNFIGGLIQELLTLFHQQDVGSWIRIICSNPNARHSGKILCHTGG
jgi:hypothetical protein